MSVQQKVPKFVGWDLTYRCNQRCIYCNKRNLKSERELTTKEIFNIIDQLATLGIKNISYDGGEPLLREDIKEIIDYTISRGIFAALNSNGKLVKEKISECKNLQLLKLSLDGPKEVNDLLRGRGSYKNVIKAANLAIEHGIQVAFTIVITKYNLNAEIFLLNLAKSYGATITFQPVAIQNDTSTNIHELIPEPEEYRDLMRRLINLKKGGNPYIGNSLAGLMHLINWPNPARLKCNGGKVFCNISPEGRIYICGRVKRDSSGPNCLELGCEEAFARLNNDTLCDQCWCARQVDLNLTYQYTR